MQATQGATTDDPMQGQGRKEAETTPASPWDAVFGAYHATAVTAQGKQLTEMAKHLPQREQLQNCLKDIKPYSGVPGTPAVRSGMEDKVLFDTQVEIEAAMHLLVHAAEQGSRQPACPPKKPWEPYRVRGRESKTSAASERQEETSRPASTPRPPRFFRKPSWKSCAKVEKEKARAAGTTEEAEEEEGAGDTGQEVRGGEAGAQEHEGAAAKAAEKAVEASDKAKVEGVRPTWQEQNRTNQNVCRSLYTGYHRQSSQPFLGQMAATAPRGKGSGEEGGVSGVTNEPHGAGDERQPSPATVPPQRGPRSPLGQLGESN